MICGAFEWKNISRVFMWVNGGVGWDYDSNKRGGEFISKDSFCDCSCKNIQPKAVVACWFICFWPSMEISLFSFTKMVEMVFFTQTYNKAVTWDGVWDSYFNHAPKTTQFIYHHLYNIFRFQFTFLDENNMFWWRKTLTAELGRRLRIHNLSHLSSARSFGYGKIFTQSCKSLDDPDRRQQWKFSVLTSSDFLMELLVGGQRRGWNLFMVTWNLTPNTALKSSTAQNF